VPTFSSRPANGGGPARRPSGATGDALPRAAVVSDTLSDLTDLALPLDIPGAEEARARRDRVLTELEVRLVPRLEEADAPAIVVLGGSSGAGKSTLINSLVGSEISTAGVLRPTTREAVLAVHPDDADSLADNPIRSLARIHPIDTVPRGVAVLDAPDLDSVDARNRQLSARLVETADLWIFVTTPVRYGDELPWSALTVAHERGVTIGVVLNRAGDSARTAVHRDLTRRLQSLGAADAPIFVVPDAGPHSGPLPPEQVQELSSWLRLIASTRAGSTLRRHATRTTWAALREDLLVIADAADRQVSRLEELTALVDAAAAEPVARLRRALAAHSLTDGSPTTRWLGLASTGGPLSDVAARPGRIRPGRAGRRRERREAALAVLAEVTGPARETIRSAVREADAEIGRRWAAGGGPASLADQRAHRARGPEAIADRAVGDWRARVEASVAGALTSPEGRAAAEALGADGVAALVGAGGAGLPGPAAAVRGMLRGDAAGLLSGATTALVDVAERAVHDVSRPYLDALADLGVEPGTGLRLRAGELKEFT
jgi:energy-coupling factor transporter ATP-binding protein EcfA2